MRLSLCLHCPIGTNPAEEFVLLQQEQQQQQQEKPPLPARQHEEYHQQQQQQQLQQQDGNLYVAFIRSEAAAKGAARTAAESCCS